MVVVIMIINIVVYKLYSAGFEDGLLTLGRSHWETCCPCIQLHRQYACKPWRSMPSRQAGTPQGRILMISALTQDLRSAILQVSYQ